ncbi:MAG: serine/threonine protein kinase, partial [Myxococcales bacterium]|nr:serine/threonine protein kinase [Myxococcales bacterium]
MTAPGSRFGRYEVIEPIGQGGMGTVLRARDPALGREVALKIVRADRMTPDEAAEYRARFFREARAAANLRHPNIVAIYDVGEEAGTPFLVMELLRGRTLRASIAGDTPIEQRLRWLVDVAEALAAAHAAGLVHRDVKPDNVLVGEDGVARVLDFGLAKRPADPELGAASTPDDAPTSFQTRSGVVLGTPRYMAPEQMVGALVDGRADQFSWGRMAYEVLGGVLPAASAGRTPSLSTLGYPDSLSAVVDRAVAPLPGQRFPSMAEALAALRDASAAAGPGGARAAPAAGVAPRPARA